MLAFALERGFLIIIKEEVEKEAIEIHKEALQKKIKR